MRPGWYVFYSVVLLFIASINLSRWTGDTDAGAFLFSLVGSVFLLLGAILAEISRWSR